MRLIALFAVLSAYMAPEAASFITIQVMRKSITSPPLEAGPRVKGGKCYA